MLETAGKRLSAHLAGPATSSAVKDGTWTVQEDAHHRIFPNRDDALDCARELAGDPDLPGLSQM